MAVLNGGRGEPTEDNEGQTDMSNLLMYMLDDDADQLKGQYTLVYTALLGEGAASSKGVDNDSFTKLAGSIEFVNTRSKYVIEAMEGIVNIARRRGGEAHITFETTGSEVDFVATFAGNFDSGEGAWWGDFIMLGGFKYVLVRGWMENDNCTDFVPFDDEDEV